jgi:hypothetical protein
VEKIPTTGSPVGVTRSPQGDGPVGMVSRPDESRPEVSVDEFSRLVKRDVKTLAAAELATLLDFFTDGNRGLWQCVIGTLGYIVNVPGGKDHADTSYTFRLIDARENPALAIHQYHGLNAGAGCNRSHQLLEPRENNQAVFAAFGRFLVAMETPGSVVRPTRPS